MPGGVPISADPIAHYQRQRAIELRRGFVLQQQSCYALPQGPHRATAYRRRWLLEFDEALDFERNLDVAAAVRLGELAV